MHSRMDAGWFFSWNQICRYFATRPSSLKPPKTKLINPFGVLRGLNRHQWLMFSVGFVAWVWDAFDYFTVSLSLTEIAHDFGVSNAEVSWGLTVTLMLRSVGALIFGTLSDRYGRKWPMIINLGFFIVLELATGFSKNLTQFLAVRSLYGIAMGGMYGPAAGTALEDLPYEARGVLSGLFQGGCSVGYLLAAVFYRALVPTTSHGWRSLFWFGAAPPILIMIFRYSLPETKTFVRMKAEREEEARIALQNSDDQLMEPKRLELRAYVRDVMQAIGQNWVLLVYMVVLMTGFNSCSHGSQDFYPTFLKNQVEFDPSDVTIIAIVGQLGSITGGVVMGHISTFFGRRLVMLTCCIFGGALVPAYIIPHNLKLIASSFFEQFFVGGVWGPIPIHLLELSPPGMRSLIVGLTYQLGNLASSASATIQAIIGERFPLPPSSTGVARFDYGKVIAIFIGATWAYLFFFIFIGPELSQKEREESEAPQPEELIVEISKKEDVHLEEHLEAGSVQK